MVFFNFYNLFSIFLEFFIRRRVGTERNDNFYFLSFSAFSNLFWRKMRPEWYFLIFQFCCYFFGIFYYGTGRNRMERQFLFSLFLCLPQSILTWKDTIMVFLSFLNFLLFFWNFQFHVEQGRNRTLIFIFSLSQSFPSFFRLKRSRNYIF